MEVEITPSDKNTTIDLTKPNASESVRTMLEAGKTVSQIAKELGIRYNFAYNVASIYVDRKYQINIKTWLKERKANEATKTE